MLNRIFLSADIEGTCGIAHWDETLKNHPDYPKFANRMSMEVAAACEGALEGGMDYVLVRDAHDSARNIDWFVLPKQAQMIRGWGQDPLCMMSGLDESYTAAVFTGYHDAAGSGGSPLSHTMSTGLIWLSLNGEPLSEGMINAYTAARFQVPVIAVTGDLGICTKMKTLIPGIRTVPVNRGNGNMVLSIHPEAAQKQIRETVKQACLENAAQAALELPQRFRLDVRYKDHPTAYRAGFYPGVQRLDSHTLRFEAEDWHDVLRMMHFCL